jgi:hypothetical protein
MDPNTTRILMAAGGKRPAPVPWDNVGNAGYYMMVPYTVASTYKILVVNTQNFTVEKIIDCDYFNKTRFYRFGSNILQTQYGNTFYKIYSIQTGAIVSEGNFPGPIYADELKFASDKLLRLGWTTSGQPEAVAYTFTVDDLGVTQITSATTTSMGNYNSFYGMINNPVIAGQANISNSTGLLTSMGTIGTKAPYDNSSSAAGARGTMTVNSSGTTITFNGSSSDNSNYSRPIAATGSNGYCLISGIDGYDTRVFSGTADGGFGNVTSQPPATNFSPAAVLNSNSYSQWLAVRQVYVSGSWVHKVSSIQASLINDYFTLQNTSGAIVQSVIGGAAVAYVENGDIRIAKYDVYFGLGAANIVTSVPGVVLANSVNPSYGVTKVINY